MEGSRKEENSRDNLEEGDHASTEPDCGSDGEAQHPKDLPSSSDEATIELAVDKSNTSPGSADTTASPSRENKPGKVYALEKAPPPVKIRRETAAASHATSPPELSPPPSPKRMRELERKEGVFRSIVPPKQGLQHNL